MSDEEVVDDIAHRKLLAGINNLVRTQDVQQVIRTEPTTKKTEFHLIKKAEGDGDVEAKTGVRITDLLGILNKTSKNADLGKELKQIAKKKKALKKPLEKPVADRIERDTLYGKTQKNLNLWEPVITASEVAPQVSFPLQYGTVQVVNNAPQKLSQYRVKSDLMKAMEELDKKFQKEDSPESEPDKYTLTLEELRQKRKEAAHQRMREAYKIAKGRRMNKIKSKKYHKLLKREKIRAQIKQFEELQKTDPEAALKQLQLIEKQRYEERASLRHKNTGSWAKNMQIRAKYDMDVRKELEEQLSIGRELMGKRLVQEESSDSEGNDFPDGFVKNADNPWVYEKGEHEKEANQELTSGYRKYWEERNKAEQARKLYDEKGVATDECSESEDEQQMELFKRKIKKSDVISTTSWEVADLNDMQGTFNVKSRVKKRDKDINMQELFDDAECAIQEYMSEKLGELRETTKAQKLPQNKNKRSKKSDSKSNLAFKKKASLSAADIELNETAEESLATTEIAPVAPDLHKPAASVAGELTINPKQFVQMKPKHLLNAIPNMCTTDGMSEEEDDEQDHKLNIAEAFEDDDIVADFEQEKQDEKKRNQPTEVDTFLEGWGSWAGPGINKKRTLANRRKLFKKPPELPRRDDNKERVIINEEGVSKELTAHLVNELPFPFVSVKDYEASLRAPLGRTFIPETAHAVLVEPRVVTKLGTVIEPMKKEILSQNVKTSFRVGGKLYNKAVKQYEDFLESTKGKC